MSKVKVPAEVFPPGEYLRDELDERGWSEAEFADIIGRPVQAVSEILNGKKEVTTDTAVAIGAALGTTAEMWLNLQLRFRLHNNKADDVRNSLISRKARLRSLVPVRELQRRGWLPDVQNIDSLEHAVQDLLGTNTLDEQPGFAAAARRLNDGVPFTPEQVGWIARVRKVGSLRTLPAFSRSRLEQLAKDLSKRIHDPTDLTQLQNWLCDCGVALVIELPLKRSKIDGVVIWDVGKNPVIGLSTRNDRMDGLIFTLLHEIAHLVLKHVTEGKVCLDETLMEGVAEGSEADANSLAARWIIPGELSFEGKPSMPQIVSCARSLSVHTSFVIGRLQSEKVLDWSDFRRSIPKVRPFVTFS